MVNVAPGWPIYSPRLTYIPKGKALLRYRRLKLTRCSEGFYIASDDIFFLQNSR